MNKHRITARLYFFAVLNKLNKMYVAIGILISSVVIIRPSFNYRENPLRRLAVRFGFKKNFIYNIGEVTLPYFTRKTKIIKAFKKLFRRAAVLKQIKLR